MVLLFFYFTFLLFYSGLYIFCLTVSVLLISHRSLNNNIFYLLIDLSIYIFLFIHLFILILLTFCSCLCNAFCILYTYFWKCFLLSYSVFQLSRAPFAIPFLPEYRNKFSLIFNTVNKYPP